MGLKDSQNMSYEDFKKSMPLMNDNFSDSWDMSKFRIQCQERGKE